jgi:Tfp pilus assembly protein PilX
MGKLMRHKKSIFGNEQGAALIATLMFLMAMGVLSTALIFTVQNEMKTSAAYKYSQEAFYVANAGVQRAVQWYANAYNPHTPSSDYDLTSYPVKFSGNPVLLAGQSGYSTVYPDGSTTSSFSAQFSETSDQAVVQADSNNSGRYALNATLLKYSEAHFINPNDFTNYTSAVERWRINSIGYWGSVANPLGISQITAIIENRGSSLFDRALWGIDLVDLGGTSYIDSYDPSQPYGGDNIGDMGSIGSNGTVEGSGGAEIRGDVAYGPTGSISLGSNTTVTGDIIHLPEPRSFPPIPPFNVGSGNLTVNANRSATISPGEFGSITVRGDLYLNPGYYYIDDLSVTSNGTIHVSGSTTIFVKSGFDLEGQGIVNDSLNPVDMAIYYSGTDPAKLSGSASVAIEYYGPNSDLSLTGGTDFFGSFIGKTVKSVGGANVHFSEASLNKHLIPRPFRLITWSQDTF